MKNIHIIPTDKLSRLFIYNGKLSLSKEFNDLASQCFGGKPKQETLEQDAELEKLAMDKLKSKWEHLYTFGYPQKPFPTNYKNDLNNVKVGLYEGAKWQQEQVLDFLYSEITERRDYSASKMCEKVIEFIKQI